MQKLSRKELKQYCQDQAAKFQRLIGKKILVKFGIHNFETVITEVKLARQADMENVPDMREGDDGKQYTPSSLQIECEGGSLFFIIEDIIDPVLMTLDGVQIEMVNGLTVLFTEWMGV